MKKIIIAFACITCISCKAILLKQMFKDPVVETTKTVSNFLTENNFNATNSFILKGDTATYTEKLFTVYNASGYYLFDQDGYRIYYNASATCTGTKFRQFVDEKMDSFIIRKDDTLTLSKVLKNTYDLSEKPVAVTSLPKTKYYVVAYWAKFLGRKKGYQENIEWMENLANEKAKDKITFIKVNTDIQESWGFVAGSKMKLSFNKNGEVSLGNVQFKK